MGRSGPSSGVPAPQAREASRGVELRISIVFRGLVFDPPPDLGRQRFPDLLLDVRHETDRSGYDRQPAAHLPRKVQLAENRADGTGRVDWQLAPVSPARLLGDELH